MKKEYKDCKITTILYEYKKVYIEHFLEEDNYFEIDCGIHSTNSITNAKKYIDENYEDGVFK
jgi:hypothetical protein